jgi:hypothetical protein
MTLFINISVLYYLCNMEQWKDIPGYEGYYQASTYGNIRSVERKIKRKDGTSQTKKSITKSKRIRKDYHATTLHKESERITYGVHRLIAMTFLPNPFNLPQVNHQDGNKLNNHLDNLEWSTGSDNIKHAIETGLRPNNLYQGEKNGMSVLTEEIVRKIIMMLPDRSMRVSDIASKFGVRHTAVSRINTGKRWSHVMPEVTRPIRPKAF